MLKKRLVVCTAGVLAVFLILVPPALAAEIPFNVYIDGKIKGSGEAVITQKNTVSVRVYDAAGGEHTVKVSSVAAVYYGPGDYRVNDYPLKTGLNKITVVADAYKNTYDITYVDKATPGASYYLSSIPASGTITAIDKTLSLKFPKNNYIVSGLDNPQIVEDQGLRIEVIEFYRGGKEPTEYHHIVSPVYKITPNSSELERDNVRQDAAVLHPGELVLKYDDSVSNASADTLTVVWIPYSDSYYDSNSEDFSDYWHNDWASRRCVVLGGSVNTSTRTITVPFVRNGFGTYAVFNVTREFTDLSDASQNLTWARNYVLPVWAKGVMEIKGSGEAFTNVSDKNITREEFTVAIVKAMGIPVQSGLGESFKDLGDLEIPKHRDYILTAARNGIIYGFPTVSGVEFRPQEYLTREQAATIIARVAGLKVSDNETATAASLAKAFSDYSKNPNDFGSWASPYIYAAYKAGFVQGVPVKAENDQKTLYEFKPKDKLTRAEAAKLIYVLMKKQKRI